MIPVVAIVGRPNVGKSTLFNFLTKSRDALVVDRPGVTRDRQYGRANISGQQIIIIDTGGIQEKSAAIDVLTEKQSQLAIKEADSILFMVDGKVGITTADEQIAKQLRKINKPVFLVVNKIDGADPSIASAEFYRLGIAMLYPIAASQGRGVTQLMQQVLAKFSLHYQEIEPETKGIKIAIIGRPNVGKSTLVNRMLGEERVIVYDESGTTRDSIFIPLQRHGKNYVLIDTAGVRRRTRIKETVEKFSVIKALQAIEASNVAVMLLDAKQGVAAQDLRMLDFIINAGKGLVIAINKWDGMDEIERNKIKDEIQRKLKFAAFAKLYYISALHGTGIGNLFPAVEETYASATKKLSTPILNNIMQQAIAKQAPPLVHGARIKLRYAHAGGQEPPIIVIHGNQLQALPETYKRYLIKFFRNKLNLVGTPIRLELKTTKNPYAKV